MVSPVIQGHNHHRYEDFVKEKLCCFRRIDNSTTTRRNSRRYVLPLLLMLLYFVATWRRGDQQLDVGVNVIPKSPGAHEYDYQKRHFWKRVHHRRWCRGPSSPSSSSSSPSKKIGDGGDDGKPGLIYIKIDKCASSTLAGMNIRIAREIGSEVLRIKKWSWPWPWSLSSWSSSSKDDAAHVCSHTYMHERASKALASQADKYRKLGQTRRQQQQQQQTTALLQPSSQEEFLAWTFVREPFERSLSEYYHFYISRLGNNSTQSSFQKFLKGKKNFQLLYTLDVQDPTKEIWDVLGTGPAREVDRGNSNGMEIKDDGNGSENHTKYISERMEKLIQNHIFESYDFVGVVERMEESLAVMKLLWGLPFSSLIVLSAKKSGGYDDGRFKNTCYRIQPQSLPSLTISSTKVNFMDDNYDYLLYDMVNASLDNTIEMLGRDIVDQTRSMIRFWQQKAEDECQQKAIFPCSKDGTPQHRQSFNDCYWFDSGCGFKCVDNVMLTLKGSR